MLPRLDGPESAGRPGHAVMAPTPQLRWPLLCERAGAELWVKHENHTPIGAFKVRGGLTYMSELKRREPGIAGVITATRGNHGQSVAFAARRAPVRGGVAAPPRNSAVKDAPLRAPGAGTDEQGHAFPAAYAFA